MNLCCIGNFMEIIETFKEKTEGKIFIRNLKTTSETDTNGFLSKYYTDFDSLTYGQYKELSSYEGIGDFEYLIPKFIRISPDTLLFTDNNVIHALVLRDVKNHTQPLYKIYSLKVNQYETFTKNPPRVICSEPADMSKFPSGLYIEPYWPTYDTVEPLKKKFQFE